MLVMLHCCQGKSLATPGNQIHLYIHSSVQPNVATCFVQTHICPSQKLVNFFATSGVLSDNVLCEIILLLSISGSLQKTRWNNNTPELVRKGVTNPWKSSIYVTRS